MRLGSRDGQVTGDWSKSGGDGQPQPDNREFRVEGEQDEACIAVLNNFYGDGEDFIVWPGRAGRAGKALNNPRRPSKINNRDSSRLEQFPLQILTSTFPND